MREPIQKRRQRLRAEQRAHVAAMVKVPISAETRARTRPPVGRALAMALAVIFAVGVHGTVIGIGWWKSKQPKPKKEDVKIVVREPPPPPPEPPEPPPPPPPKVEEPPPAPPPPKKVASAPPPPPKNDVPPPPAPPQAPKRVVGLSMEGATEGGDGPAFAVGNTLDGKTDTKAVDPKLIDKNAPKDAPIGVPTAPPPANKVATNVPGQGVVNGGGTKKKEVKPKFPEVLRAQGIEADVVLRVTFDPTGKVTKVDIVTPAAQKEFNDAAVAAAYQEEYVPATRNGVAIPKTIQFTTKFRLED